MLKRLKGTDQVIRGDLNEQEFENELHDLE